MWRWLVRLRTGSPVAVAKQSEEEEEEEEVKITVMNELSVPSTCGNAITDIAAALSLVLSLLSLPPHFCWSVFLIKLNLSKLSSKTNFSNESLKDLFFGKRQTSPY